MSEGNGANGNSGRRRKRSILPLVIGLPLIAVVAVAAIFFTASPNKDAGRTGEQARGETPANGGPAPSGSGSDNRGSADGSLPTPTLGEADAPVVMQEFSDYQ